MEVLFLAVLLGCSDSLVTCDEVATWQVAAPSADACIETTLHRDEALRVDYPTILAECRALDEQPALVAEAT